jgi:hypothetical protein
MKTHILTGSKQEIGEGLLRINGEVHEAIVFVEEQPVPAAAPIEAENIFAEMMPYMVDVQHVDESREAAYRR